MNLFCSDNAVSSLNFVQWPGSCQYIQAYEIAPCKPLHEWNVTHVLSLWSCSVLWEHVADMLWMNETAENLGVNTMSQVDWNCSAVEHELTVACYVFIDLWIWPFSPLDCFTDSKLAQVSWIHSATCCLFLFLSFLLCEFFKLVLCIIFSSGFSPDRIEGGELFDRVVSVGHFDEATAKCLFYQMVHGVNVSFSSLRISAHIHQLHLPWIPRASCDDLCSLGVS